MSARLEEVAQGGYFRATGWRFEVVEDLEEAEQARLQIPEQHRPDRVWRTKAEWRQAITRRPLSHPVEVDLDELDGVSDDAPIRLVRHEYHHPNADPDARRL